MRTEIKSANRSKFNLLQLPKQIFKFGGSSLTSAKCYQKVARLISKYLAANDLVVVSASGQTTDWLTAIARSEVNQHEYLQKVRYHHQGIIHDSLPIQQQERLLAIIEKDCQWVQQLIALSKTRVHSNDIIALGELWSAQIMTALLESQSVNASWIDARKFLKLHRAELGSHVCRTTSQRYLFEHLKSRQNRISVITGYIASDSENNTLTLGRNGSDYSATLIASLCSATKITLWTDVAGVFDFDPNLNDNATPIETVNAELLQALSNLGSPIIHHKTLTPLKNSNIQLSIRSTFSPEQKGTTICQRNHFLPRSIVTHKNDLVRLILTTRDELSSQRVIRQLNRFAASQQDAFSIIEKKATDRIQIIINRANTSRWKNYLTEVDEVLSNKETTNCSLLALVTEHSQDKPYHQQFLVNFLAQNNLPKKIIHRNKSFIAIVGENNIDRLAIDCFNQWQAYKSAQAIFLLGAGNVGKTWRSIWQSKKNQRQRVVLSANSKTLFLEDSGEVFLELDNDTNQIQRILELAPFNDKLVIDATASEEIAQYYSPFLNAGAHLISANKIASSGLESSFTELVNIARQQKVQWRQNATIGAGLPVNEAIKSLIETGDSITTIRGVFSGTLSWLLQTYDENSRLSQLIQLAQEKGYSEPDPRLDLSGVDVARKLIIAARLAGASMECSDIDCQPLLSPQWLSGSIKDFKNNAEAMDREFHKLWLAAKSKNKRLVYQAQYCRDQGAQCQLRAVDSHDPLAQITPCDNIFVIHSEWYNENPLIIRGPGAGKQVTGAAIQSDLNKIW